MARRLVLLVALIGAFLVVSAPGAHACSCGEGISPGDLAQADGAFVGWDVGNDIFPGVGSSVRYEVEWVLKGDIPPILTVAGVGPGASCGLESRFGERVGLVLSGRPGRWRANLCSEVDADQLLAAARPIRPNEEPPAGVRIHRPSLLALATEVVIRPRWFSLAVLLIAIGFAIKWVVIRRRGLANPPPAGAG